MKMIKIDCSTKKATIINNLNISQILNIRLYDDSSHHDINIRMVDGNDFIKHFDSSEELNDYYEWVIRNIKNE